MTPRDRRSGSVRFKARDHRPRERLTRVPPRMSTTNIFSERHEMTLAERHPPLFSPEVQELYDKDHENLADIPRLDLSQVAGEILETVKRIEREIGDIPANILESQAKFQHKEGSSFLERFTSSAGAMFSYDGTEESEYASARLRRDRMERDNSKLRHQLAALQARSSDQECRIQTLQREKNELLSGMSVSAAEIKKLKRMITAPTEEEEDPVDFKIQQDVKRLRDSIQSIVQKHLRMTVEQESLRTRRQQDFFNGVWKDQRDEGSRQRRLRAAIWRILYDDIFSKRLFGIEDRFQSTLGELEVLFYRAGFENRAKIAEWRRATVHCGESLQQQSDLSREVVEKIYDLIRPIMPNENQQSGLCQLEKDVRKLCDTSYEYAMFLRKCKSDFAWKEPKPGEVVKSELDDESGVSVDAFDGDGTEDDILGSKICYTIFGALTKTDWKYGKERIMVPALVVCVKANGQDC